MKNTFTFSLLLLLASFSAFPQGVTLPPASKKAAVMEGIGLTEVTINYHRPGVKGRQGKIFGPESIVPYDGNPWRAGADENTTIAFSTDVRVEDQPLKAGNYGFHIIPSEREWTLIFSGNSSSWGSYFYNAAEDALRVKVKPETAPFTEWLTYEFVNQTDSTVEVQLRWERLQIRFKIGADVYRVALASVENELRGLGGFNWQKYTNAAQWLLAENRDLDKALLWAGRAADGNWGGQTNFMTLSTKAMILEKKGNIAEAKQIMDQALPMATMTEMHQYGRNLLAVGKNKEAMTIFQRNREKYPNDYFTTLVGLARGNMAVGNYKEAAANFRKAALNAPAGQAGIYEGLAKECEEKL